MRAEVIMDFLFSLIFSSFLNRNRRKISAAVQYPERNICLNLTHPIFTHSKYLQCARHLASFGVTKPPKTTPTLKELPVWCGRQTWMWITKSWSQGFPFLEGMGMWKRGEPERKRCVHSEISAGPSGTTCQPERMAASSRKLLPLASTDTGQVWEGEEEAKITRFGKRAWKMVTTNHMQKEEAGLASLLKRMSFYYLLKIQVPEQNVW